jgi:hypothetical protein
MIPGDSAFTSLRYSSFTFGGIVGEFSSGEDMASLEGVYSEPKSCPTRLSDTPDLLAGNFRLGSWHRQLGSLLIQTIDCMFFGLATPKVLLVSDRIRWRGCEEFGVFFTTRESITGEWFTPARYGPRVRRNDRVAWSFSVRCLHSGSVPWMG